MIARSFSSSCRLLTIFAALAVAAEVLIAQAPPPPGGAQGKPTEELYFSANALYNRKLYELAVREYEAFLKEHSKHEKAPRARLGLALSRYALGDYAEAEPLLQGALREIEGAEAEQVPVLLGQCLLKLGRYEEAEKIYSGAARRGDDADQADALVGLAEALFQQQKWKDVAANAEKLLKVAPDNVNAPRVRFQEALAYYRLENFARSAEALEVLVEQAADGPLAHQTRFLLAECRRELGELDKAAEQYVAVIEEKDGPFSAEARFRLGFVLFSQDKYAEAIKHFESYLEIDAKSKLAPKAQLYLGQSYLETEAYDQAEAMLKPLVESDAPRPGAAVWLARTYSRRGAMEEAAAVLQAGLPHAVGTPHLPGMLFDLGHAQLALDKCAEAAESLKRLVKNFPSWEQVADALYLEALAQHRAGDYEGSLESCARFVNDYGGHERLPEAAFMRAENLMLLERDKEALDAYRSFLAKHEEHGSADAARFRLAQLLHKNGQWDAALSESRPLLEKPPEGDLFRQLNFLVGDAAFNLDQTDTAVNHLKQFVEAQTEAPNRDVALLKLGLAYSRRNESAPAIEMLKALAADFPESPQRPIGLIELGRLQYEAKTYAEARKVFQDVTASKTADGASLAQAEYYLGWIDLAEDKDADAGTHFKNVVEKYPESSLAADSLLQLGSVQISSGAFPEAAETLDRLKKDFKSFGKADHASYYLGVALARQEKCKEALEQFEAVIESREPSALRERALYESAWCEKKLGQNEGAMRIYTALLEDYPKGDFFQRAAFELAELEFEGGRYTEAIERIEELLPDIKDSELREQALYRLGWSAFSAESFQKSAGVFESLLKDFPETEFMAPASYQAGEARMKLKENAAARDHFERASNKPEAKDVHELALLRLGETRSLTEQWAPAEAAFQSFISTYEQSEWIRRALLGLGWARENQKKYEEAIEAYSRVTADTRRDETGARCQFQIGECLFAMKQYDEAIQALIKVSVAYGYPKWSAKALLETGRALEQQGKLDRAEAQYKEVVTEYPESDAAAVARDRMAALGGSE